jgi:hypothetical protein
VFTPVRLYALRERVASELRAEGYRTNVDRLGHVNIVHETTEERSSRLALVREVESLLVAK